MNPPANDNRCKLKSECLTCGCTLSEAQMADYLDHCTKFRKDPLDAPQGGINCASCSIQLLLDMSLDNPEIGEYFTTVGKHLLSDE